MKKTRFITIAIMCFVCLFSIGQNKVVWEIGKSDNNSVEFALAPTDYTKFLEKDFGWEDRSFIIGHSQEKSDFPFVLPS